MLASHRFKKALFARLPGLAPFYRIVYNLIALGSLGGVLWLIPIPYRLLYSVDAPLSFLFHGMQIVGLIGLIASGFQFGMSEFSGLRQASRFVSRGIKPAYFDETDRGRFVNRGLYRIVRHPLYTFSTMLLVFNPSMTLRWALMAATFTLYFWVGSYPEERKLAERFGEVYLNYKKRVPRLIPNPFLWFQRTKVDD